MLTCINNIMNKTCVVLACGLYFNMTDTFKCLLELIVEGSVLMTTQSSLSYDVDLWPVVLNQDHQLELIQHYSRSGICHKYPLQKSFFFFLTPRKCHRHWTGHWPILASGVTQSVSRCMRSASHSAVPSKRAVI